MNDGSVKEIRKEDNLMDLGITSHLRYTSSFRLFLADHTSSFSVSSPSSDCLAVPILLCLSVNLDSSFFPYPHPHLSFPLNSIVRVTNAVVCDIDERNSVVNAYIVEDGKIELFQDNTHSTLSRRMDGTCNIDSQITFSPTTISSSIIHHLSKWRDNPQSNLGDCLKKSSKLTDKV
jgi:hypothetical protein